MCLKNPRLAKKQVLSFDYRFCLTILSILFFLIILSQIMLQINNLLYIMKITCKLVDGFNSYVMAVQLLQINDLINK